MPFEKTSGSSPHSSRHARQDDIDLMLIQAISAESKRDIKTRQHLMERSFARSIRYGYKRARWRGLWRVQIQEYLTASIQNIMVLLRNIKEPAAAQSMCNTAEATSRGNQRYLKNLSMHIRTHWRSIARFHRLPCTVAVPLSCCRVRQNQH